MRDFDLIVLGGGSAGVRAARLAAEYGLSVGLVEASAMGGTCVNLGCVPKKLYVESALVSAAQEESVGFGWLWGEPHFDWAKLQKNKQTAIKRLNQLYTDRLLKAGVTIVSGFARFSDPQTILVDTPVGTEKLFAPRVLVATGGRPKKLEIPGAEYAITSDQAFNLPHLPRSVLIIGSGYIGVEFAGIFNGLGVKTHLTFRADLPLKSFDNDVRLFLIEQMKSKGVEVLPQRQPLSIEPVKSGYRVDFGDDACQVDLVMMATGREPNTEGLQLAAAGVECDALGAIVTDAFYRTSVESIDALGDVRNQVALTPVAIEEAKCWFHNRILHSEDTDVWQNLQNQKVVTAVFSQPSVATIGLTQSQAEAELGSVSVYAANFRPLKHSLTGLSDRCLFKLIVEDSTDKVVGLHLVGPQAGEIMQGFAVAIQMGATKADFDRTLAIHPTMAEELVTF